MKCELFISCVYYLVYFLCLLFMCVVCVYSLCVIIFYAMCCKPFDYVVFF